MRVRTPVSHQALLCYHVPIEKKSGRKSYRFVYVLNKLKPERVNYVYYVKSDDLITKSRLVFLKRLILKRYTVLLCGLSETRS